MATPLQRYQKDLESRDFSYDPAQELAVKHLQRLYDELTASEAVSAESLISRLAFWRAADVSAQVGPQGLYFWGGVGRGKTYLMDTFYDTLPFENKMRAHFHRFMQRVHGELKTLTGEKNPLVIVADRIADEARVICFDEFFVSDITDAMILAGLFDRLFARGVVLVATSNIVPSELYKEGLQRSRFLPAIDLIEANVEVVNVDGGVDYRLRALEQAELFYSPLGESAESSLRHSFEQLAPEEAVADQALEIEGRNIQARYLADDVAWFEFAELCDGPRSQYDYIELARIFHAVIVSNVPVLGAGSDDLARRFINLVDEFYDRNVKMVMSAEVPLAELYMGGRLSFEFERTQSRLLEMQSHEYLASEHRP
ncbi:MAG: cell division protein ZapE [Spongiibacteraceae bacterium]